MIDLKAVYAQLEERRKALGLSQHEVGQRAFGKPDNSALQNIRRGASPSIDKLEALCRALGLELSIGPSNAYNTPSSEAAPAPPHPIAGDAVIDGHEFALVRRFDIDVSAGSGLVPVDAPQSESLAFSRTWLLRQGLSADLCALIRVRGDSMAPTIPDRALVMINAAEKEIAREGVYAFSRGGEAFLKRLVPVGRKRSGQPSALVIVSDNSAIPPETISGHDLMDIRIAGRVRCVFVTL